MGKTDKFQRDLERDSVPVDRYGPRIVKVNKTLHMENKLDYFHRQDFGGVGTQEVSSSTRLETCQTPKRMSDSGGSSVESQVMVFV